MSLWESSGEPGQQAARTSNLDKHLPDNRPADGTGASGPTNRSPARSVPTRVVIRDALMLWVRSDNSIAATFSVIPDIDPTTPILVIAKPGKDAYLDVLGIPRPSF